MELYISKSALVAEIERIKEMYCYDTKTNASFVAEAVINSINNAIDTLETKEVDFDAEWKKYFEHRGNMATVNIKHLAKHFFELGIKAQKGE